MSTGIRAQSRLEYSANGLRRNLRCSNHVYNMNALDFEVDRDCWMSSARLGLWHGKNVPTGIGNVNACLSRIAESLRADQ